MSNPHICKVDARDNLVDRVNQAWGHYDYVVSKANLVDNYEIGLGTAYAMESARLGYERARRELDEFDRTN